MSANSLNEIFITIRAASVNTFVIILSISIILFLPVFGIFLYRTCNYFSKKRPLFLNNYSLIKLCFSLVFVLMTIDFIVLPHIKLTSLITYQKRFPFITTLLQPKKEIITLKHNLEPLKDENNLHMLLEKKDCSIEKKPNIFLFVIEAFRKDYITEEITPHLYNFKKNNLSFKNSFSASNCTHGSWYSIFHANHTFYWKECKDNWSKGSIPLHILKKMGYQISVFASAETEYFQMDKVLFGKDHQLLNNFHELYTKDCPEAYFRDFQAFEKLKENFHQDGNVYITFLDSSHSEYSWPKDFPVKFNPISPHIDYLQLYRSQNALNMMKNRYCNALNYIDHLFGQFFSFLEENNLFDDSIIIITGDHGEEFFEEGSAFHGSHLNRYQTSVPIFYHFPKNNSLTSINSDSITSHIDIFPSVLHYLNPNLNLSDIFNGQSIFSKDHFPFCICAQQSCGDAPNEFMLIDKIARIKMKFLSNNIFQTNKVEIIDIEKSETINTKQAIDIFLKAFSHLNSP